MHINTLINMHVINANKKLIKRGCGQKPGLNGGVCPYVFSGTKIICS